MKKNFFNYLLVFLCCSSFFLITSCSTTCNHVYSETILRDPTCSEYGIKQLTCNNCGYQTVENIEKLEHTPVLNKGYAATCTESGLSDGYKCSVCNTIIQYGNEIEALGHDFSESVMSEPSCNSYGQMLLSCSRCGYSKTQIIEKSEHSPIIVKGYAATCTESGLSDGYKCSVCNAIIQQGTTIEPLGHDFSQTIIKESSCTECGEAILSCNVCHYEKKQSLEKTEHIIVNDIGYAATCTEEGLTDGSHCSVCNLITQTQSIIKPLGHDFQNNQLRCTRCNEKNEALLITTTKVSNTAINPSTALENQIHSDKVVESYRDDDKYYYVFYVGTINNFLLHNYITFEFTKEFEILDSYNVKIINATSTQLKENYTNTIQNSLKTTFENEFKKQCGLNVEIMQNMKTTGTLDLQASNLFKNGWTSEFNETNSKSFETMTNSINELAKEFSLNYDYCAYNYWYCYGAVCDVDVYLSLEYDLETKSMKYSTYSVNISNIAEKMFASTKNDFTTNNGCFDLTDYLDQYKLTVPQNYTTNHPKVEYNFNYSDEVTINANVAQQMKYGGSVGSIDFNYDFASLYANGYDTVAITYKFQAAKSFFNFSGNKNIRVIWGYYSTNVDTDMTYYKGDADKEFSIENANFDGGGNWSWVSATVYIPINQIAKYNRLTMFIINENGGIDMWANNLSFNFSVYLSTAKY